MHKKFGKQTGSAWRQNVVDETTVICRTCAILVLKWKVEEVIDDQSSDNENDEELACLKPDESDGDWLACMRLAAGAK